jgi:hypothetical protein
LTAGRDRLLDGLQVRKDRRDVARFENEFRHVRMAGAEALGQCFRKGFNWIALPQCPEGRRFAMGADTGSTNGVTP